jgi:hypothetical protein
MSGQVLTVGATLLCAHSAPVTIVSSNTRILLGGQPAATASDTFSVAGCAFAVGPKPQPCVEIQWLEPAQRVLVGGQPLVLDSSSGVCVSAEKITQGPPSVVATQLRVKGS